MAVEYPKNYRRLRDQYPEVMQAYESAGALARESGPIDEKTSHLIQLGAAAAMRSEGAVHSHVRRALDLGAGREEVRHALLLLISTIGFPAVAAAFAWANDILAEK